MPFATRSVMVNAPVEAIWNLLVDKAEHLEKYSPYKPEIFKIHETFPNGLLRETKTAQMHMFERVTFDKDFGVVRFSVENHPIYNGVILEGEVHKSTVVVAASHSVVHVKLEIAAADQNESLVATAVGIFKIVVGHGD